MGPARLFSLFRTSFLPALQRRRNWFKDRSPGPHGLDVPHNTAGVSAAAEPTGDADSRLGIPIGTSGVSTTLATVPTRPRNADSDGILASYLLLVESSYLGSPRHIFTPDFGPRFTLFPFGERGPCLRPRKPDMTSQPPFRAVYKTIGQQEIDVDVYLPPPTETRTAYPVGMDEPSQPLFPETQRSCNGPMLT